MKTSLRGFISVIELSVIAIFVIGVGIYYYSHQNRSIQGENKAVGNKPGALVQTMVATSTDEWKTYSNAEVGLEFKYPSQWGTGIGGATTTDFYQKNSSGEITGRKQLADFRVHFSTRYNDPTSLHCGDSGNCGVSLELIQYDPNYPFYQAGEYEGGLGTTEHNIMTGPVASIAESISGIASVKNKINVTIAGFPSYVTDFYFDGYLDRRYTFITPSYEIVITSYFDFSKAYSNSFNGAAGLVVKDVNGDISIDTVLARTDPTTTENLQELLSEVYTMASTVKLSH